MTANILEYGVAINTPKAERNNNTAIGILNFMRTISNEASHKAPLRNREFTTPLGIDI